MLFGEEVFFGTSVCQQFITYFLFGKITKFISLFGFRFLVHDSSADVNSEKFSHQEVSRGSEQIQIIQSDFHAVTDWNTESV